MSSKSIVLVLLVGSMSLYGVPKNIGLKPEKVLVEQVEGFKNINRAPGLSEFNSRRFISKLPSVENNLNCNTPEVKELVKTKLYADESYDFIGGYKALKKNANSTYCSFTYKNHTNSGKGYFWIFQTNGQIDVKKFDRESVACDDPIVLEYFKKIAVGRKLMVEEFGGISSGNFGSLYDDEETHECSLAYKTSDLKDIVELSYYLYRDEDYQIILGTDSNREIE